MSDLFLFGLAVFYSVLFFSAAAVVQRISYEDVFKRLASMSRRRASFPRSSKPRFNLATRMVGKARLAGYENVLGLTVMALAVGSASAGVGIFITHKMLIAGAMFFLGPASVNAYLSMKIRKRQREMFKQLEKFLVMLSELLRSGLSLYRGLGAVLKHLEEPLRGEIRKLKRNVDAGMPVPDAFAEAEKRIPVAEFRLVSMAVKIHSQVGGNIADTLKRIASVSGERRQMADMIYSYTTEGRLSSMVIGAMPFVVIVAFRFVAPGFLDFFFQTTTGMMVFSACIACMIVGIWLVRRLCEPDVS